MRLESIVLASASSGPMVGRWLLSMKSSLLLIPVALSGGFALGWVTAWQRISTAPAPSAAQAPQAPSPPSRSAAHPSVAGLVPASSQVRHASLTVKAFGVAQTNLAAAMQLLDGVEHLGERRAILEGIFRWLAGARSPSEALALALALDKSDHHAACSALAIAWLGAGQGALNSSVAGK